MSLRQLLYSDLARQYELAGRHDRQPNVLRLLARLLHYRFLPIALYRVSRSAFLAGIPLLPGLLTYSNLVLFGLEITPRCEIGPGIFFAHTSGTVIGAARIGSNVTVFGGVTLGAKELDMRFDPTLRPELGNNVVLGAGSKVLGPVRIANNVTVGANAVVLHTVEADSTVVGIPARKIEIAKVTHG